MAKRILLFYPSLTRVPPARPFWEPLQLLHLSRMFEDEPFSVEIIDGRIVKRPSDLKLDPEADDVLCFGVTAMTSYQVLHGLEWSEWIKSRNPEIPVVWGGWHPTLMPSQTLEEPSIDIVVKGQGEVTFLELCRVLDSGDDLAHVRGIMYKSGKAIRETPPRSLVDPNDLPPLDFSVLPRMEAYQLKDTLFYMSSVGCPYRCSYCSMNTYSHRKWLALSGERVLEEISALHELYGFRQLIFWDNVFFTRGKRVEEICRGFVEKGLGLEWSAHGRVNEIMSWDDQFTALLARSGCQRLFVGAESGSQAILDRIHKDINAEDFPRAVEKLKKHGIRLAANWMVGFRDERVSDIAATMRQIHRGLRQYDFDSEALDVHLYRFVPMPGTDVYDALPPKEKKKLPRSMREWGNFFVEAIEDGLNPWDADENPGLATSSTFYLWYGFLRKKAPRVWTERLLRRCARFRVRFGLFRMPIEWYLWKRSRNGAVSPSPKPQPEGKPRDEKTRP
jgi:anaerobic magnesium-protoporphyrin IX monomethyl ester cyclase